mgnify:CR=1 FL=1|jgi:hypothetical protein
MNLPELDPFKQALIEKLSLLLFLNSSNSKELKENQNKILLCENLTKEEIIELIETEEYNNGFKK